MPQYKLVVKPSLINTVYLPYLTDYSHRYEIYYGGAGSGKSYFLAQKIVLKCLLDCRKVLICRKVMRTQKDSCWQLCLDTLASFKVLDMCSVNKSNYTITTPNNSTLLFYGLDDAEKLKSITGITDIWLEEASEATLDDATQLDLRLRAGTNNLQFFFSFNPVSKVNWVYKKWFEAPIDDTSTLILHTTYLDNRFLPATYIEALRQMEHTNYTYYKTYALGEFSSLDKLIFSNWNTFDSLDMVPPQLPLLVGLDFGYVNDPSALVVSRLDEANKTLYILDEVYEKGLLNNQIADLIKYKGLAKEIIIADSAEQKSIEEIRREGVPRIQPAAKGAGSILQGIQKLQQYKIHIYTGCRNTITEFENYSWKKDNKSGEYTNTPQDTFNHTIDALRYSLQCVENNRLKTMSKSAFGF